jgi:hypothetical protein
MAKWPDTITEDFWPFALRYMVMFHNSTTRRDKPESPFELFTGQKPTWSLADFRVFGSPTYVLHKRLQDGDHFGKWQARSWRGVYVGPSAQHASNVPLIYNPATTHVTPQFHVVFDEGFTSLTQLPESDHNTVMETLFQKASWMHAAREDPSEYYCFDSFWEEPIGPFSAPLTRKKRKHSQNVFVPHVSAPPESGGQLSKDSCSLPISGSVKVPVSGSEGALVSSVETIKPVSGPEGVPVSGLKAMPVSGSDFAPVSGHTALTNVLGHEGDIIPQSTSVRHTYTSPKSKVQYSICKGSISYQQSQAEYDLAGNIYTVHPAHTTSAPQTLTDIVSFPEAPHIFSTYVDLPRVYTESTFLRT